MQILGRIIGYLVTAIVAVSRSNVWKYALGIAAIILGAPWVANYWTANAHVSEVPLSATVFMMAFTGFLAVFCMGIYLLAQTLRQVLLTQRVSGAPAPFAVVPHGVKATGGDFIPTDDAKLRDLEDIAILKSKGILQETDVEGMASEIGHATLMRTRGRTE